ncbi:RND family efflux transporter MFP subunit [Bradyrhizobium sp. LM2.7]
MGNRLKLTGLLLAILGGGLVTIGVIARAEDATQLAEQEFDCLIEPRVTTKVGASVTGLISRVLVNRGDVVKSGQLIAMLESSVEEANLALADTRALNDTQLHSATAREGFLQRKSERKEKLKNKEVVSAEAFDEAETEANIARHSLREAELNLRLARLEKERANAVLQLRRIVSPIDGVVTEKALSEGEYRYETNHIVTIAQLDPLYVEVFLPMSYYGQTHPGAEAFVAPEKPVSGRYVGTVIVVDRVLDAASNTFGVRIELPNPSLALPAGLRCKVRFGTAKLD